jgi:hypothetical protein
MKTPTLYELTMDGLQLMDTLEATGGELTPELEAIFDEYLRTGKDKINSAACVVRELEAKSKSCKDEGDRLYDRAAMFTREADALKGRILAAVDAGFDGKLKTAMFTIWGQTSASTIGFELAADADLQQVAANDPDLVRTTIDLNRARLKELHMAGAELPRAIAVSEKPGTRYLRIK